MMSPIGSYAPAIVGSPSSSLQQQLTDTGELWDYVIGPELKRKESIQIFFFYHRKGRIGRSRGRRNIFRNS